MPPRAKSTQVIWGQLLVAILLLAVLLRTLESIEVAQTVQRASSIGFIAGLAAGFSAAVPTTFIILYLLREELHEEDHEPD